MFSFSLPKFGVGLVRGRESAGFTLTEFAAVMAISGFILIGALGLYNTYVSDKYLDGFYEQQRVVRDSMDDYFAVNGRYPCPAPANIPVDDAAAGLEDCTLRAAGYSAGTCLNGICKRPGARDTSADTDTTNDFILVGAVPYKTMKQGIDAAETCIRTTDGARVLCPSGPMGGWPPTITKPTDSTTEDTNMRAILDIWGYQMTYAVTQTLTDSTTFDNNNGAIGILTEYDLSNLDEVTLVRPPGSAHYVVVHHGENNKGAFSSNGVIATACASGTADAVNCNKSAGSTGSDGTFVAGMRVMVEGANYFDDVVMFQAYAPPSFWRMTGSQRHPLMVNANRGNIGVGADDPVLRLQVNGNLKSEKLKTTAVCDITGTNCIRPQDLYTATCSDSGTNYGVMRGFDFSAGSPSAGQPPVGSLSPQCANVALPVVSGTSGTCPGSTRVVGFQYNGAVICE